jgi:hypothetical protein
LEAIVSTRHFLFVIGACTPPPKSAVAAEFANLSFGLATVCATMSGQDGEVIEISPDQWRFLRGVYAMNPEAPRGLPYGDDAVFAQDSGDSGALLFFIDGDKPCAPMHAPPALLSLMERVTMADHRSGL